MTYALWSINTNNLLGEFDNEHDALALVLQGIERNGIQSIDCISLDAEDEEGDIFPIAYGRQLAQLAQEEFGNHLAAPVSGTHAAYDMRRSA